MKITIKEIRKTFELQLSIAKTRKQKQKSLNKLHNDLLLSGSEIFCNDEKYN